MLSEHLTDMDRYLFDLNGFIHIKSALSEDEVAACNDTIDAIPDIEPGDWYGYIHRENFNAARGIAYQQVYEGGTAFEGLINHPSWIHRVRHFIGNQGTFDSYYGDVFIDENFVSLRGPNQGIGIHSGGHTHCKRTSYRFHNNNFMCMQVNVLIALTDIGPGDGATMVIPGSHKANLLHPQWEEGSFHEQSSVDGFTGAIEVHMDKGDCIVFTDAICHGSAKRTKPGERRIAVYRYSPAFTFFRFGYRPSAELLARLDEEQRSIVWPFKQWTREPNHLDGIAVDDFEPAGSTKAPA